MSIRSDRRGSDQSVGLLRAEDVLWLVTVGGEDPGRAARRCGTTLGGVQKALYRARRHRDWAVIAAHLPVPVERV